MDKKCYWLLLNLNGEIHLTWKAHEWRFSDMEIQLSIAIPIYNGAQTIRETLVGRLEIEKVI